MDEMKNLRLVSRQLRDIQVQAEKILKKDPSLEEIDEFAAYSRELKNYILRNFPSEEITRTANDIPDNLYSAKAQDLAVTGIAIFLMPAFMISFISQLRQKRESKENLNLVRSKFSTLEFLIKATY